MKIQRSLLTVLIERLKNNILFLIAFLVVVLSLAPYIILGQNAIVGTHDTFDSYFVWYKVLAESNMLFAGQLATVPIIMNGLPRLVYGSEFNVLVWLFVFFDSYTAYVLNLAAMRIVGFVGMYLLLKNHFLKDESHKIIILGVSICFALIAYYPPGGLSVSSLPLALYAFLNIRANKDTKIDWLILILIPFYASIIFSYMFFLAMMGIVWIYYALRKRDLGLKFFGAIALMTVEFMLIEYRLLMGVFFGEGFVSHRTEFSITGLSVLDSIAMGLQNFIQGHYQAPSYEGIVILFVVALAIALIFFSRIEKARISFLTLGLFGIVGMVGVIIIFGYNSVTGVMSTVLSNLLFGSLFPLTTIAAISLLIFLCFFLYLLARRYDQVRISLSEHMDSLQLIVLLLTMCAFISLWFGLWYSVLWVPLKEQVFILRTVFLSRADWLHPLLWYLLFAISLSVINRDLNLRGRDLGKILVLMLILIQLTVIVPYSYQASADPQWMTFREFHAEELFKQIKDDIGLPQESYRIINVGFHPAISQYNGFYTLDGYFNNYPLEYKHRFRNIIAYELAKDSELKDYFDNWGSRCYVFSAELGLDFYCTKDRGLVVNNLELNVTAMHEMNVSYVFSAVNITNYAASSLQFNGLYQHPDSAWDIYLYKLL
jgi:hypothetical protein